MRKNHGRSAAARMCSMSRRIALSDATTSAVPATSAAYNGASGSTEPDRPARARDEDQREDDQDHEHHRERDRLGRNDRERHQLPREPRLTDQVGALDQRSGRRLEGHGEEVRRAIPEEIQRVVRDPAALVEDDPEHDQVDRDERRRVDEGPDDPSADSRYLAWKSRRKRFANSSRSRRGRCTRPWQQCGARSRPGSVTACAPRTLEAGSDTLPARVGARAPRGVPTRRAGTVETPC